MLVTPSIRQFVLTNDGGHGHQALSVARRDARAPLRGRQPVAGNPDCTGPVLESSAIMHRPDSIHLDLLINQLQLPGNPVRRVECPGPAPDLVPTWALRSLDLD